MRKVCSRKVHTQRKFPDDRSFPQNELKVFVRANFVIVSSGKFLEWINSSPQLSPAETFVGWRSRRFRSLFPLKVCRRKMEPSEKSEKFEKFGNFKGLFPAKRRSSPVKICSSVKICRWKVHRDENTNERKVWKVWIFICRWKFVETKRQMSGKIWKIWKISKFIRARKFRSWKFSSARNVSAHANFELSINISLLTRNFTSAVGNSVGKLS